MGVGPLRLKMKVLILLGILSLTLGTWGSSLKNHQNSQKREISPMEAWQITRFVHTLNLLFDEFEDVSVHKTIKEYRSRNSSRLRNAIGAAMVKSKEKMASIKKSPRDYLFRQ